MKKYLRRLVIRMPRPLTVGLRYPREYLFVKGYLSPNQSNPSVIFFTVGKCASILMRRILTDINRHHLGLLPLNLAGYWFDARSDHFYTHMRTNANTLICDRGILYAPLREYLDVSDLPSARILCMLRDPRDKIVSGYFSAGKTHRPPADASRRNAFLARRGQIQEMTIEEYTLQQVPRVKKIYSQYRKNIPRSRVLTYEQMWWDFDGWASGLSQLLGIELSPDEIRNYRRIAGVDKRRQEDASSHRRKGTPGDHKNKLSAGVASSLTRQFAEELGWLYG